MSVVLPAPFGPTMPRSSLPSALNVDAFEHLQAADRCWPDPRRSSAAASEPAPARRRLRRFNECRDRDAGAASRPVAADHRRRRPGVEQRHDPLRQRYDHHDEDRTDDQLPDERQIAGQIGADQVDQRSCQAPARSTFHARRARPTSPARCRTRSSRSPARRPPYTPAYA